MAKRNLCRYDPLTGLFTWLVKPSMPVKVGDVAGTDTGTGHIRHQKILRRGYMAGVLAWFYMTGEWPHLRGRITKVRNGKDDVWTNLRLATHAQNQRNTGLQTSDASGFKGVSLRNGKWCARVSFDGKRYQLGSFESAEEADARGTRPNGRNFTASSRETPE